jgi:hypothetical protein
MAKNKATRLTALLVLSLILVTAVFAACSNSKFIYPENLPTGTDIESNGGMAVRYGDYVYFVNGYQGEPTSDNTFGGINDISGKNSVKTGDIVRAKTSDLLSIFGEWYEENKDESDFETLLEEKIYDFAEVVVPRFYFTRNTSSTNSWVNGLYIFSGRLYFTTPNTALKTNGAVRNDELTIVSCDLLGNDLRVLVTLPTTTNIVSFVEKSGSVYCLYTANYTYTFDGTDSTYNKLAYRNLTGDNQEVVIAANVTGERFVEGTNTVVYIDNLEFELDTEDTERDSFKSIYSYTLLDAEAKVLINNPDSENETYTLTQVNYIDTLYVYYTIANTVSDGGLNKLGLWMVTGNTVDAPVRIIASTANLGTNYFCYKNQIVVAGDFSGITPAAYDIFVMPTPNTNPAARSYILPKATGQSSLSIVKIVGNILHFRHEGYEMTYDLSNAIPAGGTADQSKIIKGDASLTSSGWINVSDKISLGGDSRWSYYFTMGSPDIALNKVGVDEEGENVVVSLTVTVVEPVDEDATSDDDAIVY